MKLFMHIVMFGYLLPAFIIHLFERFAENYDEILIKTMEEDEPMFISLQFFKDVIKWTPILNVIASVMFLFYSSMSVVFPGKKKCTTCGLSKDDPNAVFCSNSFHLKSDED